MAWLDWQQQRLVVSLLLSLFLYSHFQIFKKAERGHHVELRESSKAFGGQFNLAAKIPGKGVDFEKSIEYFVDRCKRAGVTLKLEADANVSGFDHAIIATGVVPRVVKINTSLPDRLIPYDDFLHGKVEIPENCHVAVIGGGGSECFLILFRLSIDLC